MGKLRKSFSKTLKSLRNSKHLSLIALGEAIGISYATLSRYENEKQFPGDEELELLSDFFNVPVSYFIEEESTEDFQPYDPEALAVAEALQEAGKGELNILFKKTAKADPEAQKQLIKLLKAMLPDEDEE